MSEEYKYKNAPLEPLIAEDLIVTLLAGKTLRRKEIIEYIVDYHHTHEGKETATDKVKTVKRAIEYLEKKGFMTKSFGKGMWTISSGEQSVAAVAAVPVNVHRRIPKKIRSEIWDKYCGKSILGACYCCKKELNAFDDWHAGHIISRANGGGDTSDNLRPICGSCNLSMGTQNMDEFKARYYP
jgi:hypothetical protein